MGVYLGHDKVANGGFIGDYDSLPVGSVVEFDGDEVPAGYEKVDGSNDYSSEEIVIGTWFGKPLYSKTFYRPVLINGTSETVNHGIQNVERMWLDTTKSFIIWSSTGQANNLPFIHQITYAHSIWIHDFYSTNFTLSSGMDRSNLKGYITVNYTKTTD